MKALLRKLVLIFGILSIVFPLIMGILWVRYVQEQERLYGSNNADRKACEPYRMVIERKADKLSIKWQTKEQCSGFVLLGESYADFSNLPYKVLSAQGESPSLEHEITLLKQDELKYQYAIIVSEGEWYGINGNPFGYK